MGWVIALSAALVMTNAAAPERVAAQPMMETGEQIDASPKGLIGLGLVGAELGFVVPALAGLDDAWAFVVFPVVGAAGGALAGHFLIDNNDNEKAAVAMLSVGLALVVPSLVITLASTAYDPEDDEDAIESGVDGEGEDAPPEEEAEPPPEEESARRREMRERASAARAGGGMFRLADGELQLGLPGVAVTPTYTADELQRFGGEQRTEVRLSLFSGTF